MFHNYLADNGYTVLDIDYRASSGYGRDWRTAIYRFMGGKDLDDHIDGARYLSKELGVDAKRIGIYGGSYGGFITLMGPFYLTGHVQNRRGVAFSDRLGALQPPLHRQYPEHAGFGQHRLRPQFAHLPRQRPERPPAHFARHGGHECAVSGRGALVATPHRVGQTLGWEFAVYPMEDHGFVEPSSWADEYKWIYKLFEETLK